MPYKPSIMPCARQVFRAVNGTVQMKTPLGWEALTDDEVAEVYARLYANLTRLHDAMVEAYGAPQ